MQLILYIFFLVLVKIHFINHIRNGTRENILNQTDWLQKTQYD